MILNNKATTKKLSAPKVSLFFLVLLFLNLDWIGFYWKFLGKYHYQFELEDEIPQLTQRQTTLEQKPTPKKNRPSSILCFFVGDEGSTVLSEAFKLHPHVYSPQWHAEPVNVRNWAEGVLRPQLDAIRFLLRLPSKTTTYDLDIEKPIPEKQYKKMVGNATATYIKASICRNESTAVEKWVPCMKNALSDLLCGEEESTVDHLILPVRHGFDRAISLYVHFNKEVYHKVSQFTKGASTENLKVNIEPIIPKMFMNKQRRYIEEFMRLNNLAKGTCPNGQPHHTKIHIYDYDGAKAMGMERALNKMFGDVGLPHGPKFVNLGRFSERKPGNYMDHIFDEDSKELFTEKEREYEEWLSSTCNSTESYPWCQNENTISVSAANARALNSGNDSGGGLRGNTEGRQDNTKLEDNNKELTTAQSQSQTKHPQSILTLFYGDEGSTVLSEAFKLHPQVYSPEWNAEPVNYRPWAPEELNTQLDAIRFLLRLPSNTTTYDLKEKPMSAAQYKKRVGDVDATYIKASVCRSESAQVWKWTPCMENVLSNLLCGDDASTVDHLILPVRYGFDRVCSMIIHFDKDLYQQVSQFTGPHESSQELQLNLSEETANRFKNKQQHYIEEFMVLNRLLKGTCPNGQKHKVKVHIYDYDEAKTVGMKETLSDLFQEVGLHRDSNSVNLGRFGERKPGNYCERFSDKKSKKLISEKQQEYRKWLQSTCDSAEKHPWCKAANVM